MTGPLLDAGRLADLTTLNHGAQKTPVGQKTGSEPMHMRFSRSRSRETGIIFTLSVVKHICIAGLKRGIIC
jgi:hypothetical protein